MIQLLHLCASRWFAKQKMMDEAIDHAIQVQDADHVAALLSPRVFRVCGRRAPLPSCAVG